MGTSTGQVYSPFSLMGGGSTPVSTPFSFGTNTAGTASAMSSLGNSTNGLNTNFSLAPLSGYQNPGYQNLGANLPWNMTGSDFGNPNATSSAPTSASGSATDGGFLSHPLSSIGDFFSGVYDHLKGGMEGLASGYAGYQPPAWEQSQNLNQDSIGQTFQREFDMSELGGIVNALKGGWNGLVNDPQQAQQDYQQNVINPFNSMPAVPRMINQFVANTATDPLTYVPVGAIAKATGITPALKYGYDWAKGAVKGADALGDVAKGAEAAMPEASAVMKENPFMSSGDTAAENINKWADIGNEAKTATQNAPFNYAMKDAPFAENPFAKAAEEAAATSESVAGKAMSNPYAAYNWQSKLGAPVAALLEKIAPEGVPGLKQLMTGTENIIGKAFTKYNGATQSVVDALKNATGQRASDQFYIRQALSDMAKNHELTQEEMQQIPHVLEGTMNNVAPHVQSAANDLKDVLENGITLPNGERILGTQHELGTSLNGKPILDSETLRQNYFPHVYNNSDKEIQAAFQRADNKGISTTGPHNLERTFDTLKDAQDAGLKPELNPYKAIGQRLEGSSKNIRNAELLNKLMGSGALVKSGVVDNIVKDVKTGKASLEDAVNAALGSGVSGVTKDGMIGSSVPQLRGYFMKPADESAIRDFVMPAEPGGFGKALDSLTNLYKKMMFMFSPMVHLHNIETNGRYLGGAKNAYVREAKAGIKSGNPDEWYQKALRDGAVTEDSGRGGFKEELGKSIDKATGNASSNPFSKYQDFTHGVLWNEDKAIRTALYRQGYEEAAAKGMGDAEAGKAGAALANKFMVDYNNLTPFERTYMSRMFSFYPWMKGNLGLQANQWVNNTGKMLAYERAKDTVANNLGAGENNKGKIDSGVVLKDGSHVMIDPYSPIDEIPKMLAEGNPATWAFNRMNPFLKEGSDVISNSYINPWTQTPIWKSGLPLGANLLREGAHIGGALNPYGSGIAATEAKDYLEGKPMMDKSEIITQLFGGFDSRSNPAKDALNQAYQQQQDKKNLISYKKQQGIPVSKQEIKDAYKKPKAPMPAGYGGN